MKDIIAYMCLALGAVAWDWRALRQGSRTTRWMVAIVLLTAGVIWVWLARDHNIFRPTVWLNKLLEPFDPIK